MSLDEADDEPVRFWTYALSALGSVAPGLTRDSLAVLAAPGFDPVAVALSELLDALTSSDESYVLVLDDFHVLRDPLIHQSVEFLLAYLPPTLRVVIAGRFDPPLPLARMRARGELKSCGSGTSGALQRKGWSSWPRWEVRPVGGHLARAQLIS